MKVKTLIILFILVLSNIRLYSQAPVVYYPKEGDTIADYTFRDVINYSSKSFSIRDFRGKWLVLDWWSVGCKGCIASFPKMSNLAHDFSGKVNFAMIGLYSNKKGSAYNSSKSFYHKQEKKHQLQLTAAFDSISFEKFDLSAVPLILVIDPAGIIRAKMISLDSISLERIMANQPVDYYYARSKHEKTLDMINYDRHLPLYMTGKMSNGGVDTNVLYRSLLTKWVRTMPILHNSGFNTTQTAGNPDVIEVMGADLKQLLNLAYYGNYGWEMYDNLYTSTYPYPILETKKQHPLFNDVFADTNTGKNMFSYSIISKNKSNIFKRNMLLQDIENTLDIKTSREKRNVKVWKIVAVDKKTIHKLRTKGGSRDIQAIGDYEGFTIKNWPIRDIAQTSLYSALQAKNDLAPVILNATGCDFNIDLTFKADMLNLQDIIKKLRQYGFDLIKEDQEMNCIVIKDAVAKNL